MNAVVALKQKEDEDVRAFYDRCFTQSKIHHKNLGRPSWLSRRGRQPPLKLSFSTDAAQFSRTAYTNMVTKPARFLDLVKLLQQTEKDYLVNNPTTTLATKDKEDETETVNAIRGRSASRGRGQSASRTGGRSIECWGCGKLGHIRSECRSSGQNRGRGQSQNRGNRGNNNNAGRGNYNGNQGNFGNNGYNNGNNFNGNNGNNFNGNNGNNFNRMNNNGNNGKQWQQWQQG